MMIRLSQIVQLNRPDKVNNRVDTEPSRQPSTAQAYLDLGYHVQNVTLKFERTCSP